jgi:outer membrane lipoprotein LolB
MGASGAHFVFDGSQPRPAPASRSANLRAASCALGMIALLAGCRTVPPAVVPGPGADAPWSEQRAALETLGQFGLDGRVAVAAHGEGFSASLRFRQQADRSDLALDGPMGIGGLRMALRGEQLEVSTSRGERLDGEAARAELERRLGFALPLAELRWWLLGIPAPGSGDEPVATAAADHEQVPDGFEQRGWRVRVNSRAPALGFSLPQRLTVEREGARLKLVVERWQP